MAMPEPVRDLRLLMLDRRINKPTASAAEQGKLLNFKVIS